MRMEKLDYLKDFTTGNKMSTLKIKQMTIKKGVEEYYGRIWRIIRQILLNHSTLIFTRNI